MRLMFTGAAPWSNSGYGKPGRYLFPRLSRLGHEIALCPYFGYQGAISTTSVDGEPVRLYPPAISTHFDDIIEYHAASWQADAVITFQDVWTLDAWGKKDIPNWCPITMIDTHPVSQAVLDALEGARTPLAETRWGLEELSRAGWTSALYIPHGVDTALYAPGDQATARRAVELPEDGFLAGMVAANASFPSRKSFPEVLLAWRQYVREGGEGRLYLHTAISHRGDRSRGVDFETLLETLDLPWSTVDNPDRDEAHRARVLFPAQHRMWLGAYDDGDLANVYRSLDVLLAPSAAEGFGIPIIEAQACGTPVATLNVTSMPELTFAGVCLEPVQMQWEPQGGWRGVAPVAELADAIAWFAGLAPGERAELGELARHGAAFFEWDYLATHFWTPFLEGL